MLSVGMRKGQQTLSPDRAHKLTSTLESSTRRIELCAQRSGLPILCALAFTATSSRELGTSSAESKDLVASSPKYLSHSGETYPA